MNLSIFKYLLTIFFFLFITSCTPKVTASLAESNTPIKEEITTTAAEPAPKMTFEERSIHLGKVKKGDQIPLTYTFTNTGNADLEIDLISVCDCTKVLERPYSAIKPGESGVIKVVFDSNQKEEAETIEIDIWLKNMDPVLEMPVLERLQYTYEF